MYGRKNNTQREKIRVKNSARYESLCFTNFYLVLKQDRKQNIIRQLCYFTDRNIFLTNTWSFEDLICTFCG